MPILIKGMEKPTTYPLTVTIYPDGQVLSETVGAKDKHGIAVPVPAHGRLIDADAIRADIDEKRPGRSYEDAWTLTVIDAAPTIIPAED